MPLPRRKKHVPTAPPSAVPSSSPEAPGGAPDDDLRRFLASVERAASDPPPEAAFAAADIAIGTAPVAARGPQRDEPTPVPNGRADHAPDAAARDEVFGYSGWDGDSGDVIARLSAERDLWRERAFLWRERALGAQMLSKELGLHVSDLHRNLDDLRLALRDRLETHGGNGPPALGRGEPRGLLVAGTTDPRHARDRGAHEGHERCIDERASDARAGEDRPTTESS